MAKVIEAVQRPALILAPNKTLAAQLYSEMKQLLPRKRGGVFRLLLRLLPAGSLYPAHRHLYREGFLRKRTDRPHAPLRRRARSWSATTSSSSPRCPASTASARSRPIPAWRSTLRAATASPRADLLAHLVALQYRRNDEGFARGCFRARGDTIDIFPAHYEDRAWRVTLFGDEVDSIFEFDPLTGRKAAELEIDQGLRQFALRDAAADAGAGGEGHARGAAPAARLVPPRRQAARGAAPGTAHHVRPRDDRGDRLLRRHRELFALAHRARKPGEPPPTLFEYLPDEAVVFVDEMPRHHSADRRHVSAATIGARRRWPNTASACRPASTTAR